MFKLRHHLLQTLKNSKGSQAGSFGDDKIVLEQDLNKKIINFMKMDLQNESEAGLEQN